MLTNQVLKREKALTTTFLFYSEHCVQIQRNKLFFSSFNIDWFFIKRLSFMFKRQKKAEGTVKNIKTLHIEISSDKINDLLEQKKICAADIRCLDVNSKQCLKQLCLKTCLYNTRQSQALNDLNDLNDLIELPHAKRKLCLK